MIAVNDIEIDEILAKIPKTSILEPNNIQIKDIISKCNRYITKLFYVILLYLV
jgi:hypothetical protein